MHMGYRNAGKVLTKDFPFTESMQCMICQFSVAIELTQMLSSLCQDQEEKFLLKPPCRRDKCLYSTRSHSTGLLLKCSGHPSKRQQKDVSIGVGLGQESSPRDEFSREQLHKQGHTVTSIAVCLCLELTGTKISQMHQMSSKTQSCPVIISVFPKNMLVCVIMHVIYKFKTYIWKANQHLCCNLMSKSYSPQWWNF